MIDNTRQDESPLSITARSRRELIAQLPEINDFELAILTLLAISCEPAHTTLLINCLKRLDIKNPRGNQPTAANISHALTRLKELGLLNEAQQCAPEIAEVLCKRAIADGTFNSRAEAVTAEAPISWYYGKWTTRCWRALRDCRIAIYTIDYESIEETAEFLDTQCTRVIGTPPATVRVVCTPFDSSWFCSLPGSFQFFLMSNVLAWGEASLTSWPELLEFLGGNDGPAHLSPEERLPFRRLYFNQLLLRGQFSEAEALITSQPEVFNGTGAEGSLLFLRGETAAADTSFARDLDFLRQYTPDSPVALFGLGGLFSVLTRIAAADNRAYAEAAATIETTLSLFENARENRALTWIAAAIDSSPLTAPQITLEAPPAAASALDLLFAALCQYWLNATVEPEIEREVAHRFHRARSSGYLFFAATFGELLRQTRPDSSDAAGAEAVQTELTIRPLLPLITPQEPWRRSLAALLSVTENRAEENDLRLAWMVSFVGEQIVLSVRKQKRNPDGSWSRGRPVSPARLAKEGQFPWLSVADQRLAATVVKRHNPATNTSSYQFDMERTIPAMVGNPHLFLADSPQTPVEFVEGEPELLVEERGDNLHICFAHPITGATINFHKETPTRVKVIRISEKHRRISRITGTEGITVPREAREEVLTSIGNISSFMTVHSAIAADRNHQHGISFVEADPTIHIHLIPYGTGFRLEMFVRPFADGSHYLKPGQGVENIMAEVGGVRVQTRRDLVREEENAREVEEMCPVLDLAVDMEQESEREWHLHDPDDCLQALMELQQIRDRVVIEWPEGERLTINSRVGVENLNLKIRTNRQNWFAMSGSVELDQGKVLDLRELLARMKPGGSRFVEIGDGQFVALTQEFRRRLDDLDLFSEEKGDELLVHPLAAIQLQQLTERSQTEADSGWENQLTRIAEARSFTPKVPSTLRAELRQYQREGFEWLARLAHWGVGACLADDMGLGKTLQSLAVILELAGDGPSLVIAPTSVSTNWQTEVQRFAPTINIVCMPSDNRRKTVEELGRFDLLITTYTLLQQESELLRRVQWQAVILDEAQAIKNSATKRSQAAMALQAKFRLITTGTPIENHLGELWNLFHFINPGLLGSLPHFNRNFAIPIERYNDREARLRLKNLIRPFTLRRIKSQVLEELPSRTEVTLEVNMSPEETLFYEALRQNAIELLENSTEKKGRHLQILTEIMRLRQACCNPKLIDPDTAVESAKLKVFADIVDELLESNHKALVFSQFIGHLDILRSHLDRRNIHYQYLDGTTSSAKRKQRVDAFQAGEGDLFLISLKAGGLGLNLTAADYVIHMDPWWNPAIEDQASDRAYRIGQTRPVTIYRLVCTNTIEEKIVKLHQEKRDLAGSLLEGADMSAKMSSDDLLELIKAG